MERRSIQTGFFGMNHWHFYLIAMLLFGVAQSNSAESRVALVNGKAAYPDTPLKSSVKDARVISKTPLARIPVQQLKPAE